MNKEELKNIMPHREPMLLMDEITLDEENNIAVGTVTIRGDEYFVQGHYPDNPIVPGVILCEMAAQSCILLFADKVAGKTPFFTGINNVKFRQPVKPGDTITFKCEIDRIKEPFYFTKGKAYVNDKLCMSGEFSFAAV
jgi:3-hydroxymyristoyl/3-hydroxydecanoyl-(acyl carrier protein) dehydratases